MKLNLTTALFCATMIFGTPSALGINPVFDGWYADPEAVIYGDTYWIYPTCSLPYEQQVSLDAFSSKDLVHWTRHESIIDTTEVKWAKRCLWAPAVIANNGRYYLFFGANDVHEGEIGGIGVAVADRPEGPYKDLLGRPLINEIVNGAQPIDQFVFRDSDGEFYMYYGGWDHCNIVRLKPDFTGLIPFADGEMYKEITPHNYTEGPVMFKRAGKYYFMWSEGAWTGPDYCVSYAIADNPYGPFESLGKVLVRDKNVGTGAGHHSVINIPGTDEWYIVYHRHPIGASDGNSRVTCIDRMYFDADGHIMPVRMTHTGVAPRVLSAEEYKVPSDLRCEHLVNPLGVNTLVPSFSWKNRRGMMQTAYEIVVGTDSVSVANGRSIDLWKSGRVNSSNSTSVQYNGTTLTPREQCWWKVRVWDDKGKVSDWSPVARFGIGITSDARIPMSGSFIGMAEGNGDVRSPILRNNLHVNGEKGRVMVHISSLGYHELYINGRKADNRVLAPAMSQLDSRSLIVTYDITNLIHTGDNDISVRLGQGWYKPTTFKAQYGGPLVKIEVDRVCGHGHKTLLISDDSWMVASGGRHDTGSWNALHFGGEMVDGRNEPADMSAISLAGLDWSAAVEVPVSMISTPDMSEGNNIVWTNQALNVTALSDGSYMADMGRVITGWLSLTPRNLPAGTEVTMEYSDNLTPDGQFDPQGESDTYITSGRKGERFSNKFHHHAFRYVRISGLKATPALSDIVASQIRGAYADASTFECSDARLNAVHDMIKYTMQCLTFSGYMVDCPHLERMGYGGDGNSSTMTLQTMYDVAPTYANWLQAWGDVMEPDGCLPHVAPAGGGWGGPYWCGFIVLAPWRTYLNYGDERVLEEYYPLMKRWISYVDANSREGLLQRWPDTHNRAAYLGDWLAPWGVDTGGPSVDLVSNCLVSDCLDKMERTAKILGLDVEACEWRKRRLDLNAKIHYTFYNAETGSYGTGSQLDMAYPMLVGAVPAELRASVRENMLRMSHEKCNDHIGTGLMGVPIVTQWAIDECQPDFMATMLRQEDYPGYLHMIDNGATATWEYWDGQRSRVHNCYNGVGQWFYHGLGGIVPDSSAGGYTHFTISPQPATGVDWASVTKQTPYGLITFKWERKDGGYDYAIEVPSGSSATVKIPDGMTVINPEYASDTDGSISLSPGVYKISFRQ